MSEKLRKIRRWQVELRALQQLAEIKSPEVFVRAKLAGRSVPTGDVSQLVAIVRKHCTQQPRGWQVNQRILATSLRNAGVLHPAPSPAVGQQLPASSGRQPTVAAAAPTPLVEPSEPEPLRVEVRHIMILTSREARSLLAECTAGALPNEFASGVRSRIGPEVWELMKRQKVVVTVGRGRGTMAAPSRDLFDQVRFTVMDSRRARQDRWKDIPVGKRYQRPSDGWYDELTSELARTASQQPTAVGNQPGARDPAPSRPLDLTRVLSAIESQITRQRTVVAAVETELRPIADRLLTEQEHLASLEADLDAVREFVRSNRPAPT